MISPWTPENLDPTHLLLVWKDITYALICSGRSADLFRELYFALRPYHEAFAICDALGAAFQHNREPGPLNALPDEPRTPANSTVNRKSNSVFDDVDLDSSLSSLDETDIDDNLSVDLGITSQMIDEGADLSQWHTRSPPMTFEEIFADEYSLPPWDVQSAKDETSLEVESISRPNIPTNHTNKPLIANEEVVKQYSDTSDGLYNQDIPILSQPMSTARRSTKRTIGRLRVSDKRDLTPGEVNVVAGLLICKDSISFFLDNCRVMYDFWASSRSPAVDVDAENPIATVLDIVQQLVKGSGTQRLLLRFAYMHLAKAIDAYKAVAATERIHGSCDRPIGIRDATIAIDKYLKAKQKVCGETMKRSTLLGYSRAGRRWIDLAGISPLLVFIFPQRAETIVQNNSITDMTIRALADQIHSQYPELTKALINIAHFSGMDPANMTHKMCPIQNIVARTTQELEPIYRKISLATEDIESGLGQ